MRRLGAAVSLALAVLAGAPGVAPAGAVAGSGAGAAAGPEQRKRQVDQRIAGLRAQVAEASAQEARLLGQLDAADARLEALSAEVGALDARIVAAEGELAAAQAALDGRELAYRAAAAAAAAARRRLAAARDDLRERAVDAYTDGPLLGRYVEQVFAADATAAAVRRGYLEAVVRARRDAVARYQSLRVEAEARAAEEAAARAAALAERDVVAARADALRLARAARDRARQQVQAEMDTRARVLAEVRRRKAEFQAEIAALRRESDAIGAMLRARQAGQPSGGATQAQLAPPIPGAPVTSGYGPRRHPIFGDERMHTGVDFGAAAGTPIRAAADGVVVWAGPRGGYGLTVIIDHGDSLATLYAHQEAVAVAEGRRVRRGEVVGYVGATGYATGPHLHFEVRVRGNPVDPLPYLRA
jgi:murein DD-endopeptidase MepM/ murein hydrolase activator NlpD